MKRLFLLLFTTLMLIGCNSDDDNIYDYIGTWSGTYEGNESGLWRLVVASDGKVTGTMYNETSNENYNISGRLDSSGKLTADLVLPEDGQFIGTFNLDGQGNGNWSNESPTPARSGTWTGTKDEE